MSKSVNIARVGSGLVKSVAPVVSSNSDQARRSVLEIYKELQRLTPKFWWDYGLSDMPLGVFRAVLKQQFLKNSHLTDVRVIDRLVGETKQHIYSIRYAFYNPDHVRNYLFRENVEAKPKDFLSKFLTGTD
uniref:NADH dehydrogenase [ubiquinone] 1 alpha subcomplex subunit 6 n=1 Tax=Heterorhabditis bacteriophora TaxID=37862 RepID=A0A1I7XRW3_HETBA